MIFHPFVGCFFLMNYEELFFSSKSMFITLTNRCNAHCKKCITRYARNRNSSMPTDIYNHVIDLLKKYNYKGYINCGTGETLLFDKLSHFITCILQNTSASLRILTNGMALYPNLPDFFFDDRITWGVTLDGFNNKELDSLQQGVDLETVKQNIAEAHKKGRNNNLYLNYTLHSGNFCSLKNYIDFANQNEIPELYCTELKIYENFENLDSYRLKEAQRKELEEFEEYAKKLNFKKVYFGTSKTKKIKDKCYLKGNIYPIIDLDGSLSFCYGQEDKIIGNIMDNDIFEKWYVFQSKLINDENINWCNNCSFKINNENYITYSKKLYPYVGENDAKYL